MSLSAYAHFNLTLSVDGSTVVHCNPLSAGVVVVGHCGDALVFSVLRTHDWYLQWEWCYVL